ncbi:MAG: hypothetical protein Q4B22_11850 [Eubacteriales bacterium]|nr:hypothetical protein [Eubacteriales bacterium]
MKRKKLYTAAALALCLSMTACGQTANTAATSLTAASETSASSEAVVAGTSAAAAGSSENGQVSDDITLAAAGQTYSGTVKEITETAIVLNLEDGSEVEIPLSENTSYAYDHSMMPQGGGQPGSENSNGEPPAKPDGDNSKGEPPAKPDGEQQSSASTDGETAANADGEQAGGDGDTSKGEPPEKPDGEQQSSVSTDGETAADADSDQSTGDGDSSKGEPPAKPDGEQNGGEQSGSMGTPPGGMGEKEATRDSISVGDSVTVAVGDDGNAETVTLPMPKPDGAGGGMPGGASGGVESYDAANAYTEDTSVSGESLTSTGTDENAVLVSDGASVDLQNVTITRDSSESTGGDNSSFYGVGAAALVTDGTLSVTDSTISTDAAGGAGAFAYDNGILYISDTDITTTKDTSGGIHVAGGGTLYAWDVTASTSGESSAAIRSDRGSGLMVVDGGEYTSNGTGSPAVYSTADISVHDASLTANNSEAICIEGLNTIRLYDCNLSGNMQDLSQNDCTWNVILYQSMSGDSQVGNSTFQMTGGTLTANNGGMFYTTNTESTFVLSDVDITYAEDSEFFLKATGNSNQRGWGQTGSNGADCTFTAIQQQMEGTVIWDSISTLNFYMTDGSTLTGSVVQDETNAGSGGDGYASVYVDASSTWVVTGDSAVTNLQSEGSIVDESGSTVSIVGTDGTVYVQGDSAYTITVSTYSDTADLSGASSADTWEEHAVGRK